MRYLDDRPVLQEVESILEFPVVVQIPNDEALVNSSINLGQPFVISGAHKPVSRSMLTLADGLMPSAGSASAAKKRAGMKWLSFMQ